jgi:hypothetical protein
MGTKAITDRVVALAIKKAAKRVCLDAQSLAGHSLHSGLATTAAGMARAKPASCARPATNR